MAEWMATVQTVASSAAAVVVVVVLATKKIRKELGLAREQLVMATSPYPINGALEAMIMALDYPAWVKVVRSRSGHADVFEMLYVNRAYGEWFGVGNRAYAGCTDFDIWPREIAQQYYDNDAAVLAGRVKRRFLERIEVPLAGGGSRYAGHLLEFEKVFIEKEGVRAIIGMVRPRLEPEQSVDEESKS